MEDLLDDDLLKLRKEGFALCRYLIPETVEGVSQLLNQHNLIFKLFPYRNYQNYALGLVNNNNAPALEIHGEMYQLFVLADTLDGVNKLLEEHPDVLQRDLRAERKLYLQHSRDLDGLKHIIIFHEEYDPLDKELATELLNEKGIKIGLDEILQFKEKSKAKENNRIQRKKQINTFVRAVILLLIIIIVLAKILL